MNSIPILVIGKSGQIARALAALSPVSCFDYHCLGRPDLDITNPSTIEDAINRLHPTLVINAAAYTAVDGAESAPDIAHQINAKGVEHLAQLCSKAELPLIHMSTDYVFNGKNDKPYGVNDPVDPQGVYGASKAAGEQAVRECVENHIIIRTAWVYDEEGQNFLTKMLELAKDRSNLRIVSDQTGTPTYAGDIARAIDIIARTILDKTTAPRWGTYHLTNSGQTTWYGMAQEIFRLAEKLGQPAITITPITTTDYPTPAQRPAYSVLDTSGLSRDFGITLPPWQISLESCLRNIFSVQQAKSKDEKA